MRTLLFAPEVFEREGGIQRILRLYVKALCDLATPTDQVGLIALNDSVIDDSELAQYTNKQLYFWMSCSRSKRRFAKEAIKAGLSADRVICGHIGQLPIALFLKLLRPRIKYYLVAHGIEVWGPISWLKRIAIKRATKVICVSEYTRQQLARQCRLKPSKMAVLYNALDPIFPIAPGGPLDARPFTILTVTRLSRSDRYKGVEHLIEAMPVIRQKEPDVVLRIIGRGDDLLRLQQLATKLGLNGTAVQFLGYVSDAEMNTEMSRCNLFALPSKNEGFGLVYLEAMAHGRPCLGARAGGAPEVIKENCGVLANYGDPSEIADQCLTAIRRSWNVEEILDNARWFSYSRFKDDLEKILESGYT